MGDWRQTSQTADERLGDPPPTVHPGALSEKNKVEERFCVFRFSVLCVCHL